MFTGEWTAGCLVEQAAKTTAIAVRAKMVLVLICKDCPVLFPDSNLVIFPAIAIPALSI
jgi:hypothetical protein